MKNKILFVEDENDLTVIVADTLRQQGYEVETAADGAEGLEKFRSGGADIVVADVMMPKMSASCSSILASKCDSSVSLSPKIRHCVVTLKV